MGDANLPPVMGAPLHLSLHTTVRAAADALEGAMREEWDDRYAYRMGPAEGWTRARLSRRMVEDGYLAAAVERPVELSAEEERGQEYVPADAAVIPARTTGRTL